ncbi:uncharacterized protein LOC129723709 [Wyeomyia smithii]|uniref:uncharacterized protein LOC129723709 n=1 Tax=Wyeomyia smithii TaxID=174621 RepID=UPI0024680547|nr:uncharacterized protein LOC129723709 [Wyeomyia smithii]
MESKIQLCIRNFPDSFKESDISAFLAYFGISGVKFLKRRNKITTIVSLQDEVVAKTVLSRLHQLKILDKRLSVDYYHPKEGEIIDVNPPKPPVDVQKQSTQKVSDFVKALLAVHPVDFSQPPPPYLRYRYPRPTREIIDSICVALESVPKFYTQVLHLMNRMNLPPPFTSQNLQRSQQLEANTKKDASQQTDLTMMSDSRLADGESELESDEETAPKMPSKHRLGLIKNRFKPYEVQKNLPTIKHHNVDRIFQPPAIKQMQNIKMRLPEKLKPVQKAPTPQPMVEQLENHPEPEPIPPDSDSPSIISEQELKANRIPADQLNELHVFKNYTPGVPSNKLYIKNLAKTVTEQDLQRIFYRFQLKDAAREIDIKLMQSGRMKGQAFVTFQYAYEEDLDRLKEKPIERAIRLTNGFILKDKPMVVMYGKTSGAEKSA